MGRKRKGKDEGRLYGRGMVRREVMVGYGRGMGGNKGEEECVQVAMEELERWGWKGRRKRKGEKNKEWKWKHARKKEGKRKGKRKKKKGGKWSEEMKEG